MQFFALDKKILYMMNLTQIMSLWLGIISTQDSVLIRVSFPIIFCSNGFVGNMDPHCKSIDLSIYLVYSINFVLFQKISQIKDECIMQWKIDYLFTAANICGSSICIAIGFHIKGLTLGIHTLNIL